MPTTKKKRGFMCQSTAATAVCMASSNPARSVVVPRRPDSRNLIDSTRLSNGTAKYSRLVVSRRIVNVQGNNKRSILVPSSKREQDLHRQDPKSKPLSKLPDPLASADQVFQVVVMRVSLHCQGCAGKVKKHLSKMEGVTSFSIDLETKRVTVMGHISPTGVLESVSKIKRAEFWPC